MNATRDDSALLGRDSFPSPKDVFSPGTTIDNRFRIIGRLSRGPRGQVYITEHMFLEERLAIRILYDTDDLGGELEDRFIDEAKTLAKLNHKNIVKLFDVGVTSNGYLFATMELLKGETFDQWLEEHGKAVRDGETDDILDALFDILKQVAEGLAEAHDNGVFHHNLKPSNIYLNESEKDDGRIITIPKIIDFGHLKKKNGADDHESEPYIAPELLSGEKGDARADVFSFGVILYEAFTGTVPARKEISRESAPPPSDLNVSLSDAVDKVLKKAIHPNPDERYTAIRALMSAFDSAYQGGFEGVEGSGVNGIEPDRDRGMIKLGIGIFAILLVVLAAVAWTLGNRLRAEGGDAVPQPISTRTAADAKRSASDTNSGPSPLNAGAAANTIGSIAAAMDLDAGGKIDTGEAPETAHLSIPLDEILDTETSLLLSEDEIGHGGRHGVELSKVEKAQIRRYVREAKAAISDKRWSDGQKPFEEVLAINPERADAYIGLAAIADHFESYETAVEHVEKALNLRDRASWRLLYGEYLMKVGRKTEAEAAWRAVLNRYSDVRREVADKARRLLKTAQADTD